MTWGTGPVLWLSAEVSVLSGRQIHVASTAQICAAEHCVPLGAAATWKRWMQRQSSHREWEQPHSLGESLLPAPATGGIWEHLTLGEGQLDLRRLLSQGTEVGALALFIWAVDIAWRKEQRNVGLGSASSSSGSTQL